MASDGPRMSALLDRLTSADDVLRDIRDNSLEPIRSELQEVRSDVSDAAEALTLIASSSGLDIEPYSAEEYTLGFGKNVPADTPLIDPIEETITVEFDGEITGVVAVFPAGVQQTTGIQVARASGEKLLPRNEGSDFLAFDDITQQLALTAPVSAEEDLEVRYANVGTEDHFINGGIFIEEDPR